MRNKLVILAAVLSALGLGTAQAGMIVGTVTFGGTVTLNSGTTVAGATTVTSWNGPGGIGAPFVNSSSGNLAAAFLTPVTMATPWVFTSVTPSLWSYTAGNGDTFTFNLNAGSSVTFTGSGSSESVTVQGNGLLSAAGPVAFTPTAGTWSFTTQNPPSGGTMTIFSFSAASGTVPDGGTTAMLLGVALSGLALFRRKLMA